MRLIGWLRGNVGMILRVMGQLLTTLGNKDFLCKGTFCKYDWLCWWFFLETCNHWRRKILRENPDIEFWCSTSRFVVIFVSLSFSLSLSLSLSLVLFLLVTLRFSFFLFHLVVGPWSRIPRFPNVMAWLPRLSPQFSFFTWAEYASSWALAAAAGATWPWKFLAHPLE